MALGSAFLLQSIAAAALLASFRAIGRDMMGVSLQQETVLLVPAGVCFGAGVLLAGVLGRLSRRVSMAAGLALAGASFLAVSNATGQSQQVALIAAGCVGLGLAVPTMTALSLDLARTAPGLLFGYLFALEGIGHMAGPLANGGAGGRKAVAGAGRRRANRGVADRAAGARSRRARAGAGRRCELGAARCW